MAGGERGKGDGKWIEGRGEGGGEWRAKEDGGGKGVNRTSRQEDRKEVGSARRSSVLAEG